MKRSLAGLAVGLLVCLSGCGRAADPPAEAEPTPSVSTTTTSPPKTLSPEETVRAWVRAYNQIAVSGDGSVAHDLQAADCRTCNNLMASLVETIKNGGSYRGGDWGVARTHLKSHAKAKAIVYALISMAAGSVQDRAGAKWRHFAAERDILEFHLKRDGAGWYISFLGWLS